MRSESRSDKGDDADDAQPERPLYSSLIGTWYNLWYPGVGWDTGRFVSTLGRYDSDSTAVYDAHLTMFDRARIDFIIIDATNGLWGHVAENARRLFDHMARVPGRWRVKVAFGVGEPFWNPNHPGDLAQRTRDHEAEVQRIWDGYAQTSTYFRYRGKPLLVNYVSGEGIDWDDNRFYVAPATVGSIQGGLDRPLTRQRFLDRGAWGWVADVVPPNSEHVHVTPGWNVRHRGGVEPPVERGYFGNTLITQFLQAISHRPRSITVGCFNDFSEESASEPAVFDPTLPINIGGQTVSYGTDFHGNETPDLYWQYVEGYSLLRQGLQEGFYYREVDNPDVYLVRGGRRVYQFVYPGHRAVIVVPNGWLSGMPIG